MTVTEDSNADLPPDPDRRGDQQQGRFGRGAVTGLVATGLGLGVAELVSSASRRLKSPVLDVGDRFIDAVPAWLKNLAIEWFGTNDKIALLAGIGLVLALYGAACGVLWFRSKQRLAIAAIAVFGLVGSWAASNNRSGAPWFAPLPSLFGALSVALTLALISRLASTRLRSTRAGPLPDSVRRRFVLAWVTTTALAIMSAGGGRLLRRRFSAASSRDVVAQSVNLAASTDRASTDRASTDRASTEAAPDTRVDVDGVSPFFTPNADFYRIDTALDVPQVPIESWQLKVTGMVEREIMLDFDGLLERTLIESDITLTCVSNEIGGGLVGTARWTGIRLDDLLADAGVLASADQIVGRSIDGFTAGFPVAALDGRDALIAIAMNGEPLPLAHGFPARLIVPGLYGYVSATKWLTEIELTRFDEFEGYWVPRGWDALGPIKTQSRIDTPRPLASLDAGPVMIAGVAWAQTRGIDRVEIQVDDGEWADAELGGELNNVTWRQWALRWVATPGRHTLRVRATDRSGAVQTAERATPMPNGATGQHEIVVIVT